MKVMDAFIGNSEEPTPIPGILPPFGPPGSGDLNLIYDYIMDESRRGELSLPGPPPPPADLGHGPLNLNLMAPLQHSSSPPSKPVLVSRGTACEPPSFSAVQRTACSQMASPHPSRGAFAASSSSSSSPLLRGRGASCPMALKSPGPVHPQPACDTEFLERVLDKPRLVVVEEPKDRGMRFRYECEGRSAGSILGASSTDANKTQPAIEIQGSIDKIKRVKVIVSLVTKDLPHRPHPHCLVGKDCPHESGICEVSFNPHNSRRHSFANLGIQCVKRKDLDVSLKKRRSQNIDPFHTGHTKGIEDMDMNAVRLCFQCELEREDGSKDSLNPVVSKPIYDKKATTTSQLKICQLNHYRGTCTGKTEIYMLCDKVQKDDIEILFRHGAWKANGEFAQTDVHRQIAIVFKTPPFQDQDISEEVEVDVVLRRISDQMESEPIAFTYLPHNCDPYEVRRKRTRMKSDLSFKDKPCVMAESAPGPETLFFFLDNMMPADEKPHAAMPAAPPAAPPMGDMSYCEAQDQAGASEEAVLINQLLESPEFWEAFQGSSLASSLTGGFDPPEAASTLAGANVNFNQNFGMYSQDFSQCIDSHFNTMVNENQILQAAAAPPPQDEAVQVKMEEEL